MRTECKTLEFKLDKTKTYLKTVSAYANYGDGEIVFGVGDDGNVVGVTDQLRFALDIENQINDCLSPRVDFSISKNNDGTLTLFVKKGAHTPYLYNGKAFKRNDTSTVEVDEVELRRLYMEGNNQTFDSLKSNTQNLTFAKLEDSLIKEIGIKSVTMDTMKSLNLFNNGYYNNAAALLADCNDFPGIDIAVFGDDINQIKERVTLNAVSLIEQFNQGMVVFRRNYTYEEINGGARKLIETIPEKAFKEALSNAITHRVYDVNANTKIAMYKDKISITSPGGLPYGINKNDYLNGSYSILRNPIIASVLNRIKIIEAFATGIQRIKEAYADVEAKPEFVLSDNSISVILPRLTKVEKLTKEQRNLTSSLSRNIKYSRKDIEEMTNLSKDKVIRLLNSLVEINVLTKEGANKNTLYYLNN